jgi:hypothetical protein
MLKDLAVYYFIVIASGLFSCLCHAVAVYVFGLWYYCAVVVNVTVGAVAVPVSPVRVVRHRGFYIF